MKSYYFTEEHEMFRQSLREFLQKEVAPNIEKWEEDQRIPRDIWHKMGEMGFLGLSYPETYGGSNLDFFYDVIFCEETAKPGVWASVALDPIVWDEGRGS